MDLKIAAEAKPFIRRSLEASREPVESSEMAGINLTKSKDVQITASSKKDAVLMASEGEDIDTLKTQKRHKRNNIDVEAGNLFKNNIQNHLLIHPETSEFSLGREDKQKDSLTTKISHIRADSNKSGNLSASRPSSSTRKVAKPLPPSANLTLKRAIQKVKVGLNPNALTIKTSTSFSTLKLNKPTATKTPTIATNTSVLRSKIEATIDKEKNKNLDKISRKIASLIRESGTMRVTKIPKKEPNSSNSRDSISSTSQKRFTSGLFKPSPNPNSSRKSQVSSYIAPSKQMIKPVLEEYKVGKQLKKEKGASIHCDQLAMDQKMTTSNLSSSSQMSSNREYLHKARIKEQTISRDNQLINKTNKSSTSNSRLSSRGTSISGLAKPHNLPSNEKPASLKNLLKQIHNDCKDSWTKQDPTAPKKAQNKPLAVPASPFVRLKPKTNGPFGITTSQKLK